MYSFRLKLTLFLQTLEMKITTEIQRNAKLLHLLNEEVICLTLTDKNIQFRAKIGRRRSRVRLRTALKRFCFKIEHFSLI